MPRFGRFELLATLARGGMAEVFLARQRSAGRFERVVVVKRMLPYLSDDPRFIEMFLEEARIAALLEHPNVIPTYDFGRQGDSYFLAMPYVHGVTVSKLVKSATREGCTVELGASVEIVRQALAGLHYAHELKGLDGSPLALVHRDVSPGNLMVNDQGRVMLLDFGIASVADSTTTDSGSLRGKVAYMSPEQIRGDALDRRSDLFSLGVVFFELLVGRRLFKRGSDMDALRAVAEGPIPDPREERPELPGAVAEVVNRALERDRHRRFADGAAMRRALDEAVAASGVASGEAVLAAELRRWHGDLLDRREAKVKEAVEQARDHAAAWSEEPPDGAEPGSTPAQDPSAGDAAGGDDEAPTTADGLAARPRSRRLPLALGVAALLVVVAIGLAVLLARQAPPPLSGPPLVLALTPNLPAEVLTREWEPMVGYIASKTGRPVRLLVAESYEEAAQVLLDGTAHVADLTPYPYLVARSRDPELVALATGLSAEARSYESYLVVRRDDGARGIADLEGKRICFVDPSSTSGFLMPRVMVRKAGFEPDQFFSSAQFSGNHFRALEDLLASRCDVAAVNSTAYLSAAQEGISPTRVRIVVVSDPLPHGVFCASSKLAPALVERLRRALLAFEAGRDLGRPVLSKVVPLTGFVPVDTKVFDELAAEVSRLDPAP